MMMKQNFIFKVSFLLTAVLTALCTYLCTQSTVGTSLRISECLDAQYAVIAFCPFVYYLIAKHLNIGDKIGLTPFFCDFAVFNIIAASSAWVFQEIIFPYFAADTTSEIYMYLAATGAFFICKVSKDNPSAREIILSLALIVATLCLWVLMSPRVQEITKSLCEPMENCDIEGEFINWFSQRLYMLKLSISGDLSPVNPYYLQNVIKFCPIASFKCLGNEFYVYLLLGAIAIQNAFAVVYAAKYKNPFNTFVAFVMVTRTVMGLASNLFLIFSSRVTVPFTVTPFDIVVILAVIAQSHKNTMYFEV